MKFNTVAEAFNFYKNHTNEQLEQRANEINHMIETDENVDIQSLNVELTGIAQAKRNNDEKIEKPETRSRFTLIGSRDDAPKSFKDSFSDMSRTLTSPRRERSTRSRSDIERYSMSEKRSPGRGLKW